MGKKNVNGDVLLDCFNCSHSQSTAHPYKGEIIVCSLTMGIATKRCLKFCYEPGTDQGERNEP
jgi:hypothetical protein